MFVILLSVFLLVNSLIFVPTTDDVNIAFEEYNRFFNKSHTSNEIKNARFRNFVESGKKIKLDNARRSTVNSAWFGFTKFSDLSPQEFKQMNGFRLTHPIPQNSSDAVNIPRTPINWVAAGKTTGIKDQGICGSCWTFSAVETVESANLMRNNPAARQHGSEQELVDCCHADGSNGCDGGDPRAAIQWVHQVGGIDLNSCYVYQGVDGPCRSSRCRRAYSVAGAIPIGQNEGQIYQALARYGPLSIAVDAEQWQHYGGGIVNGASGCGRQLDHAVQLVGYGPTYGGYWVVRNSWGAGWGEGGYILLAFGGDICGMASYVTAAVA